MHLEREVCHERVRAARVAAVEADDAGEAAKPLEEPRGLREQPGGLDIRRGRPAEQQVHLAGAVDLIGDGKLAATGVMGLRNSHDATLPPLAAGPKPTGRSARA